MISSEIKNDTLSITIDGDIEMTTLKQLKNELLELVDSTENNVEIDFSKVDYIDSSGIGVLLTAHKRLKAKEKNLKLINLTSRLSRILELSSLNELIK